MKKGRSKKAFRVAMCLLCVGALASVGYMYARFMQEDCAPMRIHTFDYRHDPYHPSVKYFPGGWNGYEYWMVESPFSPDCLPRRDSNEVPEIHVSHDGIHWEWPEGLDNPLVKMPREELDSYVFYSDPHIVMNGDAMEVWYRRTNWDGQLDYTDHSLRKVCSTDGVHWSGQIVVTELKDHSQLLQSGPETQRNEAVCPTLCREGNGYVMYYVRRHESVDGKLTHTLQRSYLKEGGEWTAGEPCKLQGAAVTPWHIDVQCIEGTWWLIVYDDVANRISLWKGTDGLNFTYIRTLLNGGVTGAFYGNKLYRACLVKAQDRYRLYFTGDDGYNSYIGLMEGESPETMQTVAVDGEHRNCLDFVVGMCYKAEALMGRFASKVRRRFHNH